MKIATWIVITHFRPEYLGPALDHLRSLDIAFPKAWTPEIVVTCHHDDRHGIEIVRERGCRIVLSGATTPGGKRNAALAVAQGELVMTSDDDDFPSRLRPREAIAAYEAGYGMSGIREHRRLHVPSGMVVRWCGRGGLDEAPVYITMARNYKTALLRSVHGWNDRLLMMEETDLHQRLHRRYHTPGTLAHHLERDLGVAQSDSTVFLQHDRNLIADRPMLERGQKKRVGTYTAVGEGHWSEIPTFPREVAGRLGLGTSRDPGLDE